MSGFAYCDSQVEPNESKPFQSAQHLINATEAQRVADARCKTAILLNEEVTPAIFNSQAKVDMVCCMTRAEWKNLRKFVPVV